MNAPAASHPFPGSPLPDQMLAAVRARDAAWDGRFVFGVRTTGIYCRPSCASRPARADNITFHADAAAAERAGFRACKRCRPDRAAAPAPQPDAVRRAVRLIEAAEEMPPLAALAAAAGYSPTYFHRLFRAATGVTPRAYAAAHRARRVVERLPQTRTVTEALHEAGYGSASRFYEAATVRLGMTPTAWRGGGAGVTVRFAVAATSLGALLVAATDRGVCAMLLGDDADALVRDLQDRFPHADLHGGDATFDAIVAQAVAAVEMPATSHALPLDIRGTAFQQQVWEALRALPPGAPASYAAVATAIGRPGAARAVARACAGNPLAVVIPCHRVVRQDGGLSGYRWGVERKRKLLLREAEAEARADVDVDAQAVTP